jgi:hypothetical protein
MICRRRKRKKNIFAFFPENRVDTKSAMYSFALLNRSVVMTQCVQCQHPYIEEQKGVGSTRVYIRKLFSCISCCKKTTYVTGFARFFLVQNTKTGKKKQITVNHTKCP